MTTIFLATFVKKNLKKHSEDGSTPWHLKRKKNNECSEASILQPRGYNTKADMIIKAKGISEKAKVKQDKEGRN